jgi:hypothetical protein
LLWRRVLHRLRSGSRKVWYDHCEVVFIFNINSLIIYHCASIKPIPLSERDGSWVVVALRPHERFDRGQLLILGRTYCRTTLSRARAWRLLLRCALAEP